MSESVLRAATPSRTGAALACAPGAAAHQYRCRRHGVSAVVGRDALRLDCAHLPAGALRCLARGADSPCATATSLFDIVTSARRVFLGFALAALVAVPLGIVMGVWQPAKAVMDPFVSLLRPLPSITWIPLTILWLGIGEAQKVAIVFMGSWIYILLYTYREHAPCRSAAAARGTQSWAPRDIAVMREVILPGALPGIIAGLKVTLAISWSCVLTAEMIAAQNGLGALIWQAKDWGNLPLVLVGMLCISLTVLVADWLMVRLERAAAALGTQSAELSTMPTILSANRVTKVFPGDGGEDLVAIHDLSLDVAEGEFVCLLGASGCGKSTMLSLFAGFLQPNSGQVTAARPADHRHRAALWHGVPVLCVVSLEDGARQCRIRPEDAGRRAGRATRARAQRFIDMVKLTGFEDRYPAELSGGMQQRVTLARILAADPGGAADGRTVRGTRRDDAAGDAGGAAASSTRPAARPRCSSRTRSTRR